MGLEHGSLGVICREHWIVNPVALPSGRRERSGSRDRDAALAWRWLSGTVPSPLDPGEKAAPSARPGPSVGSAGKEGIAAAPLDLDKQKMY